MKYFKEISTETASLANLIKLLKDKPMSTREIRLKTNWTRGQIGGVLRRAKIKFMIKEKDRIYSLVEKKDFLDKSLFN